MDDEDVCDHDFGPWIVRHVMPLALMRFCLYFGCPYQEIKELD